MEEKNIREKNRTSIEKIENYDRLGLVQMKLETRDSRALGKFLKNRRRWSREIRVGRKKKNEIKIIFFIT